MKAFAWSLGYIILYAAVGGAFLWMGVSRGTGFYVPAGLGFLILAAWEGRTILREYRAGRTERPGWHLTINAAYVILALCYIARSVTEPTGFNVGLAVCWSLLGILYAVQAVQKVRTAGNKKEEL